MTLQMNYARAPFFKEDKGFFSDVYSREWPQLLPLLDETTGYLLNVMGLRPKLVRSSDPGITTTKSELVLDICRRIGAKADLSGPLGRDYLDLGRFRDAGIEVEFYEYVHRPYHQAHGGFVSGLSMVDLLFNRAPQKGESLR